MPTTANLALPYPSLSSAPNVPSDLGALAAQIEAKFASSWTALTIASGFANYTGVTGPVPGYRVVGTRCHVYFWVQRTSGTFTLSTNFVPFAAGALPVGIRPANRSVLHWGISQFSNSNPPLVRVEVAIDGSITVNCTQASGTAPSWVHADFNFEINY